MILESNSVNYPILNNNKETTTFVTPRFSESMKIRLQDAKEITWDHNNQ